MTNDQLTPHLWFEKEAAEPVNFYLSLFENSRIIDHNKVNAPFGLMDVISFELWGSPFLAMNAGPRSPFNQAVSFFVYCGSEEKIDRLYAKLCEGGTVMMPLDKYDWTSKYAWVQDKYGISWQLDIDDIKTEQKIVPALMFANEKGGRVKEAIDLYTAVFPDSRILMEYPFPPGFNMPEGSIMFSQIKINGNIMNCMGSHMPHHFDFNESISFMITCDEQDQIDHYWNSLSGNGGEESYCGWLKDRFGVSWQVTPADMGKMMGGADKEGSRRAFQAMLQMRKFDLALLRSAYAGN